MPHLRRGSGQQLFSSPGKITLLLPPAGPGIRHDSGSYEGWTVPIDYDPLLAKLIGYGADRRQAIMRLQRALHEYFAAGIKTNISLFKRILQDPDFIAGKLDTGYLDRLLASGNAAVSGEKKNHAVAAVAAALFTALDPALQNLNGNSAGTGHAPSNWKQQGRAEALQ